MKSHPLLPGPGPQEFVWATGIEDTFVPQIRPGHRALDEYQLMGHYEHWREDLALARELGVQAIRWGIPWYRVQPFPGEFDWSWTDQVIPYMVEELKINPILDLMHYGCPFWLRREFASDEYPEAVAAYAGAVAKRYAGLIRWYTPLNEPIVNALFCGKRGLWPPYLRGDAGYLRIMLQLVRGIQRTVAAIKEVDPGALMVHVEATGLARAAREDLQALAVEDQRRGYLAYDLLTGRLTPDHPLFTWLLRNGAGPDELASIRRGAIPLDVIGMNFYPQWSTQQVTVDKKGRLAWKAVEQDGAGFMELIRDYWRHYQVPIMVTETSARGAVDIRASWLETSVGAIRSLRAEGVPVLGYTWFPLFTMIDWRYRFGKKPLEDYRLDLGLYTLAPEGSERRWQATPLVERFQGYVANPEEAVGRLEMEELRSVAAG
ncbi:MAG TPA: family 1 glycosylhydrolase [Thermoanaerobaculia bacterium]